MPQKTRVQYLKIDRGRYYHWRVALDLQAIPGARWLLPCGDVAYTKAVQIIVTTGKNTTF